MFGAEYGYGEVKNVLSEGWLRRSEKRFERSEVTEKKKARAAVEERRGEFILFCLLFLCLTIVCFVWLKLQERVDLYILIEGLSYFGSGSRTAKIYSYTLKIQQIFL